MIPDEPRRDTPVLIVSGPRAGLVIPYSAPYYQTPASPPAGMYFKDEYEKAASRREVHKIRPVIAVSVEGRTSIFWVYAPEDSKMTAWEMREVCEKHGFLPSPMTMGIDF